AARFARLFTLTSSRRRLRGDGSLRADRGANPPVVDHELRHDDAVKIRILDKRLGRRVNRLLLREYLVEDATQGKLPAGVRPQADQLHDAVTRQIDGAALHNRSVEGAN